MPSTTSLYTGLSALSVNSQRLDSIGNNIANVNTTAFKSSRMLFSSQFARTLGVGTAPGAFTGGTNPSQVGLGVGVGLRPCGSHREQHVGAGVGVGVAVGIDAPERAVHAEAAAAVGRQRWGRWRRWRRWWPPQ